MKSTLSWIMNSLVEMAVIPTNYKRGLIVPIPKPNKDCTIQDNNRGITLLPVMYKLFEKIMIELEDAWLRSRDAADGLQSAGQKKCSCLHASLVVQETVIHGVNKGATVYAAFLDTKKAFDTVWTAGLMYKLYKAGINRRAWRLIRSGYTNFQCTAFIAGKVGEWF